MLKEHKANLEKTQERSLAEKDALTSEWKANYETLRELEKENIVQEWKLNLERTREQAKAEKENLMIEWKDSLKSKDLTINELQMKCDFLRVYIFFSLLMHLYYPQAQMQEKERIVTELEGRISKMKEDALERETGHAVLQRNLDKLKTEGMHVQSVAGIFTRSKGQKKIAFWENCKEKTKKPKRYFWTRKQEFANYR